MNNLNRMLEQKGPQLLDLASRRVRECFRIKQVFFAQTISGTIHTSGTIDGKTAFARAGVTVSGNLTISWSNDETTFVTRNE